MPSHSFPSQRGSDELGEHRLASPWANNDSATMPRSAMMIPAGFRLAQCTARLVVTTSNSVPVAALIPDAARMPIFAGESSGSSSARPARNRAMVKPIPPRHAAPASAGHETPADNCARPHRTLNQLNRRMPSGFPKTRPAITAIATGERTSLTETGTPAFASAKTGMMAKPTRGCSVCSR